MTSLFDRALEEKVAAIRLLRAWIDQAVETIPIGPEDVKALFLPNAITKMPLATVSSDILSIAETFPGGSVDAETSPILDHFVYLERPANTDPPFRSFIATWNPERNAVMLMPFTNDIQTTFVVSSDARRILYGTLRLSHDFLIADRISRPERRRAQRAFPEVPTVSTVSTLRLRRQDRRESEDSRTVEWSHRWLVRGHWRRLRSRTVWVTQHVKGPSDRPLILKEKRVRFDR